MTILLTAGLGTASADMVILKSGEMFETTKAWKANGVVNYYQNGQLVRVDEKHVERMIQSRKPAETKPPPDPQPIEKPPSTPSDYATGNAPAPLLPAGDDAGYLGMRWGQMPSQTQGLALVETDPAYGGVEQYTIKRRNQRFGRAKVDNIFYGFWQNGLYTILVEVSNFLDFMDLKAEAFRRYGEVRSDGDQVEKYRWKGNGSDRLLSYDNGSDTGFLWMRSKAMHETVKERYPD